jgi:hypothetical protein
MMFSLLPPAWSLLFPYATTPTTLLMECNKLIKPKQGGGKIKVKLYTLQAQRGQKYKTEFMKQLTKPIFSRTTIFPLVRN